MNGEDIWKAIANHLSSLDFNAETGVHRKYVGFINCSLYLGIKNDPDREKVKFSYENIRQHIKGHVALGGDDLALFSCIYFYCWPNVFADIYNCFENNSEVDLEKYPDDSNYRRTWGGTYASTLGSVCHEIGHMFDLGHTDDGIMGSGLDYINRVFLLNRCTENLPKRLFQEIWKEKSITSSSNTTMTKRRCTKFQRSAANEFIDNYRQQQQNEGFYFKENSAIILSHHPWLKDLNEITTNSLLVNAVDDLDLGDGNYAITIHTSVPMKLLEIRESSTDKVIKWYEFAASHTQDLNQEFRLPYEIAIKIREQTHYLFVLALNGCIKTLYSSKKS